MRRVQSRHLWVETSVGKGYIDRSEQELHDRYTPPVYYPYVVLADGTREDLPQTPNMFGPLGNAAVDMLRDRLREGPRIHQPEAPEEPCTCLACKHFGGHR